jgi:hypothetical protein
LLSPGKQLPERHFASVVGGPQLLPFFKPHRLSPTSHTPERQARVPFATEHVPLIGAVAGSGWPFAVFAAQMPAAHHSVAAQSVSSVQLAPHAPVTRLHVGPA